MNLKNKKALVTGASKGIGKAIVFQLAERGVEVIVHYNSNKEAAEKVVCQINSQGGRALLLNADFNDPRQALILGDQAWDALGGIDILINNAGVSYKKPFLETTVEEVDHFTNVNYKSTLLLTSFITNKMVASKVHGSVYTMTSVNAIQPGAGFSVYGATKGALETLMKGIALELAPYDIRVNTLVVGAIETDINAHVWQNENKLKEVEAQIPMGRLGKTEEIAAFVCSLLSADSYLTGSSIRIDGGWLLNTGVQVRSKT